MSKVIKVTNKNNEFQRIEVLKRNRKKRSKYGEFFVEGAKNISSAVNNGWSIRSFIYSYEAELSGWANDILKYSNVDYNIEVSNELMQELSDKEEGSEILAIVKCPENNLKRLTVHDDLLVVVFDRPSSYGNLGTLIRTCEALKVDGIIITGHSVDLYDTRTIRASLGTFFSIPIITLASPEEVNDWFKSIKSEINDFQVVGSTSQTEVSIDRVDFKKPTALLVGNETVGLSYKYKNMSNELVKIPMYGNITSFNVSCAASIIIYEIDRQRRLG